MSKRSRNQFEGTPTRQARDNFSIKMKNDSNRIVLIQKVRKQLIH